MVESPLHKTLKKAVETHHASGCHCWEENYMGFRGKGCLRVDLCYTSRSRYYLVECETKPSIPRLQEKGRRRNNIHYRTVYVLVMPEKEYFKRNWSELHGYFDTVYAYDIDAGRFTVKRDLRTLGAVQDVALDALMPVIRSKRFQALLWWLRKNKNLFHHCLRCLQGNNSPWPDCWHKPCIFYRLIWGKPDDHWDWSPD
jgi:hypothetical protein